MIAATAPGLAGTPDAKLNPVINPLAPSPVPTPMVSDAAKPAPDAPKAVDPTRIVLPTDQTLADTGDEDADAYVSLAAAVADQDMPDADAMDEQLRCLATGVYFESKGEPLSGQLAVAKVIINRSKSGRFPSSVCGVLLQPHQFSFVRGGRLPAVNTSSQAWRTAVAVAQVAQDDDWSNPVPGALYFHARYVSPGWRMARVGTVGNHIFYR